MPCYTDECNQAPFELFDPTLIYPERSPRGATPSASPWRPNLGQICYPLCFENDPFCLSYNPFLLITIWIAYVCAYAFVGPPFFSVRYLLSNQYLQDCSPVSPLFLILTKKWGWGPHPSFPRVLFFFSILRK